MALYLALSLIVVVLFYQVAAQGGGPPPNRDMLETPEPNIISTYEPTVFETSPEEEVSPTKDRYPPNLVPTSCPIKTTIDKFSYDEESKHGPMMWGKLGKGYEVCDQGRLQSPIDIPTDIRVAGMRCGAKLHMMRGPMIFKPMSHNWKFECQLTGACGFMSFLGRDYFVDNVHFHKPSEHRMNGMQFPLEANIEYRSESGRIMVIVVLFRFEEKTSFTQRSPVHRMVDTNKEPVLETMLKAISGGNQTAMVDLPSFVNERSGFCAYMGSLTTPPCSEGVTYLVSLNVPMVSERQVHDFWISTGFKYGGNSRPLKPINGREVTCYVA